MWRECSTNHIGLFTNYIKKGSEIKLFLSHQMQYFIRQVDVQPPQKSLCNLIH